MLLVNKLAVAQPANVNLHGTRPWHPKNRSNPSMCVLTQTTISLSCYSYRKHLPVSVSRASYDSLV